MSHLKIIKKISLIVSLLIFLVIELTSITLVNSDGYEKAYYLQIIAIACTLFLMFTYTKELMNEEEGYLFYFAEINSLLKGKKEFEKKVVTKERQLKRELEREKKQAGTWA
jgi:hypothetical protein